MAIKKLQTRLQLKYDSYANWTLDTEATQAAKTNANLVLLAGELGICAIENKEQGAQTAPTVLFKVGDGVNPFKSLKWASALAADVYSWAKASDVDIVYNQDGTKAIKFIGGATDAEGNKIDKLVPVNFATPEEVAAAVKVVADDVNDLTTRMAAVEATLGVDSGSEDSVSARLDAAESAIEAINNEENGILASAKAYTDEREVKIKEYADQAEADAITSANAYTDGKVTAQATKDNEQDAAIAANTTAIEDEASARATAVSDEATTRANADAAIEAKIGTVAEGKTVVKMIEDAQAAAAEDAAAKVNALGETVTTHTTDIAAIQTDIADLEAEDDRLDERLQKVEAFFAGAAEDETIEGELIDALDTLKEIQDFATGEGTAAQEMLDAIDANTKAIEDLEKEFADGGRVKVAEKAISDNAAAIADNDTDISNLQTRAQTLEAIVAGYAATNDDPYKTVKAHVDAVSVRAEKGITDAKAAQDDVDALELIVGNETTGLGATYEIASGAARDLATLTGDTGRIKAAETKIATLEGIVNSGEDKTIRDDVTALQTLTGDATKGNEKLRSDLDELAGKVNDTTTGLAATKAIADEAKSDAEDAQRRVAAIEEDYLTAVDAYIFNCGSATTVTHEMHTQE